MLEADQEVRVKKEEIETRNVPEAEPLPKVPTGVRGLDAK